MRFTRNGRSRAITAACPAAALLTEKPTPSGRTCTSKRSFETSIPTNTSCDAIILSPSCDCGREPRQLFGREMRGSAGALLETGKTPRLLTVAAPPQPGPWPRPALRRALWTMPHRQDCFVARFLAMTGRTQVPAVPALPIGDGWQAGFAAGLVDDLQDALAVRQILEAELLDQPGVVDQVIAGSFLAPRFVLEADLRIRQELAHEIGKLAKTDRRTAGIVHSMSRFVGQQYAREHLGDVVDMDRAAHCVLVRERDRLAARRESDAFDVIDRADDLVGAGHIGRADRSDLHPVFFAIVLRLPFVEDLMHRVLHVAVAEILLGDHTLAIEFLFAADRQ